MKKIVIILSWVLLVIGAQAGVRTPEQAASVAASFTPAASTTKHSAPAISRPLRLAETKLKTNSTDPAMYIFNREDNAGFVVVSGDDLTDEVLLYTDDGAYDPENVNPNMAFFLNYLQERLSAVNEENVVRHSSTAVTPIAPLLGDILWDQAEPYNNLCPMDPTTSERAKTGCVATAAAQIMRYWRYPVHPMGYKTYTYEVEEDGGWWNRGYDNTQTISLDYDAEEPYDWDLMLPSYEVVRYSDAQANEVARLMYHTGVAASMRYSSEGSGTYTDSMGIGLVRHFGYIYNEYLSTDYSYQGWSIVFDDVDTARFIQAFNTDLEAGRPILIGGYDSDAGGHEFVCDGRDAQGRFHINWGWAGSANCYTYISVMEAKSSYKDGYTTQTMTYHFNNLLDAIVGLRPQPIDTVHVEAVVVSPEIITLRLKESSELSVLVTPSDATLKKCTWYSSNPAIVSVDETGHIKGLSAGTAMVYAEALDRGVSDYAVVTVLNESLPYDDCDDYSYLFVSSVVPRVGANQLGAYSWTITKNSGAFKWSGDETLGLQMGTKQTPVQQVSLQTGEVMNCYIDAIIVEAACGEDGDAELQVFIDGDRLSRSVSLNSTNTKYVFSNSEELRGSLELRFMNTQKPIYLRSIAVRINHQSAIEEVEARIPVSDAQKVIIGGHIYIIRCNQLYDIQGQIIK